MAYSSASFASPAVAAASTLAARTPIATSPSFGPPNTTPSQPGPAPAQPPKSNYGATPPAAPKTNPLAGVPPGLGFLAGSTVQTPPPGASPAYMAYLRGVQYQQQVAELAAQRQLQGLQGQMVIGPEQLAAAGVISRRNISGAAESRGTFESGQRLQDLGDERTQEAQRLAALRLQGAESYASIISNLQGTLAASQNQQAENALAAGG